MAITERELKIALLESGRPVAPSTLTYWRKVGLLPSLASRSRGRNQGRECYWPDDAVFDRAVLIYDLLRDQVDKRTVQWLLWLCGFTIPLPDVRRGWPHVARFSGTWTVRPNDALLSSRPNEPAGRHSWETISRPQVPSRVLLQAALTVCGSLTEKSDTAIEALIAACDRLLASTSPSKRSMGLAEPTRAQMISLLKAVWFAARSSNLVSGTTDAELIEAQRHAAMALRVLQRPVTQSEKAYRPRPNAQAWPIADAMKFGAPLFAFILVALRSGERELLGQWLMAADEIKRPEIRTSTPAVALAP